jgi:hypothetical protein
MSRLKPRPTKRWRWDEPGNKFLKSEHKSDLPAHMEDLAGAEGDELLGFSRHTDERAEHGARCRLRMRRRSRMCRAAPAARSAFRRAALFEQRLGV